MILVLLLMKLRAQHERQIEMDYDTPIVKALPRLEEHLYRQKAMGRRQLLSMMWSATKEKGSRHHNPMNRWLSKLRKVDDSTKEKQSFRKVTTKGERRWPSFRFRTQEKADPHNLVDRFVTTHEKTFPKALEDIKSSTTGIDDEQEDWSSFIFPRPSVTIGSNPQSPEPETEAASASSDQYALETQEAGIAYLNLPTTNGVNLRSNYISVLSAVTDRLNKNNNMTLNRLVGNVDDNIISSVLYFYEIAVRICDREVAGACARLLTTL